MIFELFCLILFLLLVFTELVAVSEVFRQVFNEWRRLYGGAKGKKQT